MPSQRKVTPIPPGPASVFIGASIPVNVIPPSIVSGVRGPQIPVTLPAIYVTGITYDQVNQLLVVLRSDGTFNRYAVRPEIALRIIQADDSITEFAMLVQGRYAVS